MITPSPDSMSRPLRFKFLQAVLAFLVLPGVWGFLIPLGMAPRHAGASPIHWAGVPVLVFGIFLLMWCVRDFYVAGKGTLAPWAPPRNLVRTGLYRHSRNPMYIGVSTILVGWALWFMSSTLAVYALAVMLLFHLRVVLGEEPWLAETHGEEWVNYANEVPRWFR